MKKSIGLIFAAALFALTPMSLYAQDSSKTAQDSSKSAKDSSKTAQDSSKTAQDSSKSAQDSSKTAQDSSKTAQDSSKSAKGSSKTAQDSSKSAKDSSKTAQDSSKTGSNPKSYASVSSLIANAMHAAKDDHAVETSKGGIETSKGGIVADDARVYVDAVQAYYDAAKTFSASFDQSFETVDGVKKASSGVVWFKKPGLMRWDYEKPESRFLLSDGSFFWSWEPVYRQFCKQNLATSQLPTALTFLAGTGRIEDDFSIKLGKVKGDQVELLLTPLTPSLAFESIRFDILMPTAKVYRVTIYDAMGNINKITFKSPEINAPLDDASFKFVPPADAKQICD